MSNTQSVADKAPMARLGVDADVNFPTASDGIQSLDLSGTDFSDSDIHRITKISSLREVNLVFTDVTGSGIRQLAALPNLQSLSVWHQQLDADGVAGLQNMLALRDLYLWIPNEDVPPSLLSKINEIRPDLRVAVLWKASPDGHPWMDAPVPFWQKLGNLLQEPQPQ